MSKNMNEEVNSNILMTDAEEATAVEPKQELPAGRQRVQFALLLLASIGLGVAANHVWANRAEYKALVGIETKPSYADANFGSSCGVEKACCSEGKGLVAATEACSMKDAGECPLAAGKSGCSSEAGLIACTGSVAEEDSPCCTKMSAALAAAMLERKSDEKEVTVVEIEEPPAPAMPEDL